MSVYQNEKTGLWYYFVRYKDANGETKSKKGTNKNWKRRKQAEEAEREFLLSIDNIFGDEITYLDLYKSYKEYKKNKIKQRSFYDMVTIQEQHIIPFFGDKKIANIDKKLIKKWQNVLLEKTYKKKGKDVLYSNKMIENIQTYLKMVFNYGVDHDLINKNPFKIEFVKRDERKKEMEYWKVDEFNKFLDHVDTLEYKALFRLLFFGGLRKGELLALQVKDFHKKEKYVTVDKQWNTRHQILTTPKTANSYRDVFLDNETVDLIAALIDTYKTCRGFKDETFIFGFDKPKSANAIETKKNKVCKDAKVKQIRIHDFRHSHVAFLINNGVDGFQGAKRLGHTEHEFSNTYGHMYKEKQKEIAESINIIINQPEEKTEQAMLS